MPLAANQWASMETVIVEAESRQGVVKKWYNSQQQLVKAKKGKAKM